MAPKVSAITKEKCFQKFNDQQIKQQKKLDEIDKCPNLVSDVRLFLKMQVTQRNSLDRFSIEQKILSQNLYYKSPLYYAFLRDMRFTLLSPTSINRWLPIKDFLSGFDNKEAIFNLRRQLADFDNDIMKYSCITFDEVHCRPELEYNDKHDQLTVLLMTVKIDCHV